MSKDGQKMLPIHLTMKLGVDQGRFPFDHVMNGTLFSGWLNQPALGHPLQVSRKNTNSKPGKI